MARGVVGWVRAHDPDGTALHKAVKVAVAVTVGLAIGTLVGNAQMSLFASFGGVAFLLFADFPGNRTARLGAYLGLFVVGAVLIALGTLMSGGAASAVIGMAVIGFVVLFSGVLSAAVAGASRAALLTFILPVMVPVPVSEIPSRWAGWALAAALSIPAAVLVWPPRDHDRLRRAAGAACSALADQLAAWSAADADALNHAQEASTARVTELRTQFRRTNVRPVGLTTGSRHLMRLTDRLEWLRTVLDRLPPASERTAAQLTVTEACVSTLRAAAAVFDQAPRRPTFAVRQELSVQLRGLQQLHVATETFARLVGAPATPDARVVHPSTMLELAYTTRLTGLTVAASAAADARPLVDRLLGRNVPAAGAGPLMPVHRVLLGHLSLRSVWFQNSVRGALGLAIAVAIAEVTEVAHGFWVVLGAMSVLRTTALTTGSTALRALSGTVIGFVAGSVVMVAVGTTAWHLWLLLPITLLIAAYLPEAVSFTAGQAAFTVLVVVLFNIIAPSGWEVGLVRVEDVLFGCVSALVSGVLLWPRGAAAAIRSSLAEFYRQSADAVVASVDRMVGPADATAGEDSLAPAMAAAAAASLRLDDALREYLFERGTRNVPLDALIRLSNGAVRIRMTAEAIAGMPPVEHRAFAPAGAAVARSADGTRGWFRQFADRLATVPRQASPAPLPAPAEPTAEATVLAAARQILALPSAPDIRPDLLADGRTLWSAALYLDNLAWIQRRLVAPAGELAGTTETSAPAVPTATPSTSRR